MTEGVCAVQKPDAKPTLVTQFAQLAKEAKTPELCMEVLQKEGMALQYVPKNAKPTQCASQL
jgi:hypothetical protein